MEHRSLTLVPTPPSHRHAEAVAPARDRDLARMLEAMEYGMVLTDGEGRLRYVNGLGREELDGDGPLCLRHDHVVASVPADQARFRAALGNAARGRRELLTFEDRDRAFAVSVAPLSADDGTDAAGSSSEVLVIFARRPDSTGLVIDFYARSKGLTGAEATVLMHLSHGLDPIEIASHVGVAISTIRSQIAAIRAKTGVPSIRALLDHLAMLPPIRCALRPTARAAAWRPHAAQRREARSAC